MATKEQYVVDQNGNRTAVLLDVNYYDDPNQTVTILDVGNRRDVYN